MPSSICYFTNLCSSDTTTSSNSLADATKIGAIVIGSILGFAFLICVVVVIYLVFCKRKSKSQVWVYPCSRPEPYGQSMGMFPYTNYPREPIQPTQTNSQRIVEELPPAYEDIDTVEDSTKKF